MNSIAALKGNLGLRSSPLSPTASKLSTQCLVLDHMTNHYKKISSAKSAIDSKPPKSMVKSQKARDNKTRKNYESYVRSQSCTSLARYTPSPDEEDICNEDLWDDPEDEDEQLVHSIMRTTLQRTQANKHNIEKTLQYHQDLHHSNAMVKTMRPLTGRSTQSFVSNASRLSEVSRIKREASDGDLLSKRSQAFTEPTKPFTPRTLKSNRKSRLSEYKYYTPPKDKRNPTSTRTSERQTEVITNENSMIKQPQAKPRKTSPNYKPFTESNMYESLQSHDFESYEKDPNVPPLDITVDKDHMNWLEEQASKAKQRARVTNTS